MADAVHRIESERLVRERGSDEHVLRRQLFDDLPTWGTAEVNAAIEQDQDVTSRIVAVQAKPSWQRRIGWCDEDLVLSLDADGEDGKSHRSDAFSIPEETLEDRRGTLPFHKVRHPDWRSDNLVPPLLRWELRVVKGVSDLSGLPDRRGTELPGHRGREAPGGAEGTDRHARVDPLVTRPCILVVFLLPVQVYASRDGNPRPVLEAIPFLRDRGRKALRSGLSLRQSSSSRQSRQQ